MRRRVLAPVRLRGAGAASAVLLGALLGAAAYRVHALRAAPLPPAPAARAAERTPAPSPPAAAPASPAARRAALPPGSRRRAASASPPAPGSPAGEVDAWVRRLTTTRRAEMERALERLEAYRPLVSEAMRREGIPEELIYVALIESSFRPGATSRAGAAGVWQFMPATAAGFGLEVSAYVDERRDPVRATRAAARYLAGLHRRFGSWHLAAAAYNAGEGRVERALRRTLRSAANARGDEWPYWLARPALPEETRQYVPKLLAAARIGRDPGRYGFAVRPAASADPLAFRLVSAPGGVPLDRIAAAVGEPADAVRRLNPHLVRGVTPPGRRWAVRVPPGAAVPSEPRRGSPTPR